MRQERTVQASIFDVFAGHEIGRELKAMSDWLDAHRALLGLVAADLRRDGVQETGRRGLPGSADRGAHRDDLMGRGSQRRVGPADQPPAPGLVRGLYGNAIAVDVPRRPRRPSRGR